MKVAIINQPLGILFVPVRGGSLDIWTYEVARRLASSYDVIVYGRRGRSQKRSEYDERVLYRRISGVPDDLLLKLLGQFSRFRALRCPLFASGLYYLGYALKIARDLRRQQCDIVHIHNFSQFAPVIRAFNPKIRIIVHMNCEWLTQLDRTMIARRLKAIDLVIGCSEYITKKMQGTFHRFADRCHTVFNGVDVDYFCGQNEREAQDLNGAKRLLFVGRISPEKGLHVLIDAFQKVVQRCPQARLEMVGPEWLAPAESVIDMSDNPDLSSLSPFYKGSYLSRLRERLFSLNIPNHVSFSGFVPYRQLISHYHAAQVFIFPSVWGEPFGMPLAEAMACELPVVATRVGGITEIVEDGKTGLLVEPGDVGGLAHAIVRLLESDSLRKSMGCAARKRALELFSWDRVASDVVRQYRNLCESHS